MEKVNVLACACDICLNFLALLLTRYCFAMYLVVVTENIYHTKSVPLYVSHRINKLLSFDLITYRICCKFYITPSGKSQHQCSKAGW